MRIFTADKLVAAPLLNRCGLQVFRAVAARVLYRLRRPPVGDAVRVPLRQLQAEGYVVLEHFLPDDLFAAVAAEARALEAAGAPLETAWHGPTQARTALLDELQAPALPAIRRALRDPRLTSLVAAAEQRSVDLVECGKVEFLTHGDPAAGPDPETVLHSDTFFATHKAWLYLDDVRLEDGPFAYVPRSHRVTLRRLAYIYRHSVACRPSENQSRRVTAAERAGAELAMAFPANTLVLANTCGYHRRTPGRPGATRRTLHFSVRANPFQAHRIKAHLAAHPSLQAAARRLLRPHTAHGRG